MDYNLIINNFDTYDEDYINSFVEYGDFSFLPEDYSMSLRNAFIIITKYSTKQKWRRFITDLYSLPIGRKYFNIDLKIILTNLEYLEQYGWYTWVSKVRPFMYI